MTPNQKETLEYASKMNQPFSTRELARYLYPYYFFRGKAWVSASNKNIWAYKHEDLENLLNVKKIKSYDFSRRAIMTTSARLSSLESVGAIKRISGSTTKWTTKL